MFPFFDFPFSIIKNNLNTITKTETGSMSDQMCLDLNALNIRHADNIDENASLVKTLK